MKDLVHAVQGGLVCTLNLDAQQRFFEEVFGLREHARETLEKERIRALWGLGGCRGETVLLTTPGSEVGIRLLALDPPSAVVIREGAAGVDIGALKVVDFVVRDYSAVAERCAELGYPPSGPATYSVPGDGRFTEGHVQGPEGVICALLALHDLPRDRFVRITESSLSEVLGISAPVEYLEPSCRFYETLGLREVYRYDLQSSSFEDLIGAGRQVRLRGRNFSHGLPGPMLGLVSYGLPPGTYGSLAARARLPSRGLVAASLLASSTSAVERACRERGFEVVHAAQKSELAPHGAVSSLLLAAPHGVLHHVLEPLEPSP